MCVMKRTFHPVGQGAFYTEEFFFAGKPCFNMVYDCGSKSLKAQELANVAGGAFPARSVIDAVFISHFDSDHVNGLPSLISSFRVKRVFLPFFSDPFEFAFWKIKSLADAENVCSRAISYHLLSAFTGNERDHWRAMGVNGEQPQIVWVPPFEGLAGQVKDRKTAEREESFRAELNATAQHVNNLGWTFNPFNFKRDVRANGFKDAVEDALKKCGIAVRVDDFIADVANAMKGNGAKRNLKLLAEVDRVLKDKKVRDKGFSRRFGSINGNSMALYSGPKESGGCLRGALPCRSFGSKYKPGCLYLGDFEGDRKRAWGALRKFYEGLGCWGLIGCVQLPHHGAKGNYHADIDSFSDCCHAVSFGVTNTHGHPDWSILKRLHSHGHDILIANEVQSSWMVVFFEGGIPERSEMPQNLPCGLKLWKTTDKLQTL